MRKISFLGWLLGIFLISGMLLAAQLPVQAGQVGTVDFEGLPAGTIVDQLSKNSGISGPFKGTIDVFGFNPGLAGNTAVIFDSANPTGEDYDLGTPNEAFQGGPGVGDSGFPSNNTALGNILIIAEDLDLSQDGLVAVPDDADLKGEWVTFEFSTEVTVNSITVIDVEAEEFVDDSIELSGPSLLSNFVVINPTGDNGVRTIDGIGLSGVNLIKVNLDGSGAIAEIVFNERVVRPCWTTFGGFRTAAITDPSGQKLYTFGGNIGPPASGAIEVINHVTGDNFHTNDVQIDECIEGDPGPGQPGGKKGFDINRANFSGTGRLNGVDGFTFTGHVIDNGEPAAPDEFHIFIDGGFDAFGELDGGNVQIHPPVGKP